MAGTTTQKLEFAWKLHLQMAHYIISQESFIVGHNPPYMKALVVALIKKSDIGLCHCIKFLYNKKHNCRQILASALGASIQCYMNYINVDIHLLAFTTYFDRLILDEELCSFQGVEFNIRSHKVLYLLHDFLSLPDAFDLFNLDDDYPIYFML